MVEIKEPQVINPLKGQSDNGWHFEQQVYDAEGIARAVKAGEGSGNIPKVIEPRIIKEGNYSPSGHNASSIVSTQGIAPAVMENHGTVTAIREPNVLTPKRTEFGKAVRKAYENKEIEMSRHDMTTMEPRTDGVSNTLTSVQKDNYLAIPEATAKGYAEAYEGDSVNLAVPNSKTRRGRVGKQMANTLDTGCQQGVVEAELQVKYRIRKLTPRECFRLMGVDDADIDKLMNASISNSQLYKCAGNSIVVDTLYHLFRKLFCDKESEEATYQQTLF
jgi:DNA (cytosine-5)-methyltransferase 1